MHALSINLFRFIWWVGGRAGRRAFGSCKCAAALATTAAVASARALSCCALFAWPAGLCRPHDGTVLFVFFRAAGLFRPKCERDEYMIRTPPSYRGGRHFGAFLLIQARGGLAGWGAAAGSSLLARHPPAVRA